MVYNIMLKVMDDKRGRFKKGRNHRDWHECDLYLATIVNGLKNGETRKIAYEVENIYSGITLPWILGSFTLVGGNDTRYFDGSLLELVTEVQYPEYADKLVMCL